jgi:methylenetetrahydrofolate reductase (NADPH)
LGATPLCHLTCFSATREEIKTLTSEMRLRGIENVLALRGDIPDDVKSGGHYAHACDLVAELKAAGHFCIGAACYPEGHVESANQAEDIRFLKEKVDAGCDFLTTQMFFDNAVLYKFLYKIRAAGITVPVLAGIMPVTNKAQIKRIIDLSGTSYFPSRFRNIVDKFGDHPVAMRQAGIVYATEQAVDLLANDVSGIHIYTMNKPEVAAGIMANLSALVSLPTA